MKKISKVLCIALSFMMFVNLACVDILAADVTNDTVETGEVNEPENSIAEEEKESDTSMEEEDSTVSEDQDSTLDEQTPGAEDQEEDLLTSDTEAIEKKNDTQVELLSDDAVTVKVNDKHTGFLVSWNSVSEAIGYKVIVKKADSTENVYDNLEALGDGEYFEPEEEIATGVEYTISVYAKLSGETETPLGTIPAILLGKPEVTATSAVGSITVNWKAVKGASTYLVNNAEKGNVTTYTEKNLTSGKSYTYKVKAVAKLSSGEKEYTYESEESAVSATVKYAIPGKVSGLTAMDGEKCAILTWDKASGASTYNVFRYNSSKKRWDIIKKNVSKTTYTDSGLTAGKKYKYRVAAVNGAGETGTQSASVTVSVKKTPGTKVRTIGYKAVVKSRAPIFTSKKGKKIVKYLAKGTRITTTDYGSGRYEFKLADGKTYWISKDRLTLTASIWTTKDYSTKTKTDFVNKKGYKSSTKYLIWINQYTQKVMIYTGKKGNWKLIRSCKCATGTHLHYTPRGVFKITYKEKGWFYKTTYEKPIVHFKDANSFHSRIKNYKGGYADATIGRPKSKGCVRLYDEDIVFIYENCPKGTTVVSH